MRIKIEDGSPHEDGCVYLALREIEPNHIMLEAVGPGGAPLLDNDRWDMGGGLLTITGKGKVALGPAIFPELGFPLDRDGRLTLDEYVEAQTATRARYAGQRIKQVK
jgi:hypothetical protein